MTRPSSQSSASWWGRLTSRVAHSFSGAFRRIEAGDVLQLIATTTAGTLLVSFLTFYIYDILANPAVLKAAVVVLSFLTFLFLFLHFRARWPQNSGLTSRRSISDETELIKISDDDDRFSQRLPPTGPTTVSTPYPAALVRVFALGICSAALGLVILVIGILTSHFASQFGGSAMLAVGCIVATLAVLHGEKLDEQRSP